MPRQKSPLAWFAISAAMAFLSIANAARIIGEPARWVDVVTVMAFAWASGIFFSRGMQRKRMHILPPEIPGGPPNVPK